MLGMFSLLPLLKGWEYKVHQLERKSLVKGADPIEVRLDETGWLLAIRFASSDCYAEAKVSWQGADLETSTMSLYAEHLKIMGGFEQDPLGYVHLYQRPNPQSTAGAYGIAWFLGGGTGALWPYFPTVIIGIRLREESTQQTAYGTLLTQNVAITNKEVFIGSLRRILWADASLKIDPALLVVGPAPLAP
jgi:hypothetical protein